MSELLHKIEDANIELYEEMMVLKEIYMQDIAFLPSLTADTERLCSIQLEVHPATGADTHNKWVSLILHISPHISYPNSCPHIDLLKPRGLSEECFNGMITELKSLAKDSLGSAMIYNLIEKSRDLLTTNNTPSTHCTICLQQFTHHNNNTNNDDNNLVKTSCYHYYHTTCLLRYRRCVSEALDTEIHSYHQRKTQLTIPCPVCRKDIKEEVEQVMHTHKQPSQTPRKRTNRNDDDGGDGGGNGGDGSSDKGDNKDNDNCKYDMKHDDDEDDNDVYNQEAFVYKPTAELKRWQTKMKELYERQDERGGIIDVEKEKKKNLINISGT